MLLDKGSLPDKANDQAEGLRLLRRSDVGSAAGSTATSRVQAWPRIILLSEYSGSDLGARFAFHLASALGSAASDQDTQRSLLVDLAPAVSRLPTVLADVVRLDQSSSMWSAVAAGRWLSMIESSAEKTRTASVAAESHALPAGIDQLPRLYEQLMRQLGRQAQWQWIVLLAVDSIVPFDRPCWQAADDIVLLGDPRSTCYERQAAVLQSRCIDGDPRQGIWALPTCSVSWRSAWRIRSNDVTLSTVWKEAGIATRLLPAVRWPSARHSRSSQLAQRADAILQRSASLVAHRLHTAAGCEAASDVAKLSACGKKIQLTAQLRPITQLSEVFRA